MNYRKPFIYICLSSLVAILLVSVLMKKDDTQIFSNTTLLEPAKDLPELELIDSNGKPVSLDSFKGKWTILTFGFTHCPDICPSAMASFKNEISGLDANSKDKVQFVFISVDPKRDSPESLKKYASFYSPEIKTYTASKDNLDLLVKSLGAMYELSGDTDSNIYEVGHSPYFFVINPKLQWRALFTPPILKGAISEEINKLN